MARAVIFSRASIIKASIVITRPQIPSAAQNLAVDQENPKSNRKRYQFLNSRNNERRHVFRLIKHPSCLRSLSENNRYRIMCSRRFFFIESHQTASRVWFAGKGIKTLNAFTPQDGEIYEPLKYLLRFRARKYRHLSEDPVESN